MRRDNLVVKLIFSGSKYLQNCNQNYFLADKLSPGVL